LRNRSSPSGRRRARQRPSPPPLALVGTIAGDDESFGIFLDQSTKVALRLKIGDDFPGLDIANHHGREVTMVKDEQGAVLTLPPAARQRRGRRDPSCPGERSASALGRAALKEWQQLRATRVG